MRLMTMSELRNGNFCPTSLNVVDTTCCAGSHYTVNTIDPASPGLDPWVGGRNKKQPTAATAIITAVDIKDREQKEGSGTACTDTRSGPS